MSSLSDTERGVELPGARRRLLPLAVDRIACTGHGICASLLPEQITVDEWGYPVLHSALVDADMGQAAIQLCPARALAWSQQHVMSGGHR